MTLPGALSFYICLNAMVAAVALVLWVRSRMRVSASQELKLHYRCLGVVFLLTAAQPLFPRTEFVPTGAHVWSAPSIKSFSELSPSLPIEPVIAIREGSSVGVSTHSLGWGLAILGLIILLLGLIRLFRDLRTLAGIRLGAFRMRSFKRIHILVHDEIDVPYSFWIPGRMDIVVPAAFLTRPVDLRMAIAHEIQHHRQGDTSRVYALWALKVLCIANPFAHLWARLTGELQEFACDETLVDRRKVESRQYARCLVELAQTANNRKYGTACATGLLFPIERKLLKRRIEKMFNPNNKTGRSVSRVFTVFLIALLTGVAFASSGVVQDRRVSMEDAEKWAAKAREGSRFPIVMNDLVLTQLNKFVGTPEGRKFVRGSLERMEQYRPMIEKKLAQYGVPRELMAVPITESGYQNLKEPHKQGYGSGLWMFMKQTAINYGLTVNDQVDERVDDVEKETDAAMRLLKSGELQFQDWQLSLMAYNAGEGHVLKAIKNTGSRDPWKLVRAGYENDKNYLSKTIAMIVIMKNPEVVL